MQTAYTVLILLTLVAVSRPLGRLLPHSVAVGADRCRGLAGLADPGVACGPGPGAVSVFVFTALAVFRRLAHAQA